MEWLLGSPQLQHNSQLIMQVGSAFCVQENCLETLSDLLVKLSAEDRTLRTFRRALGFSQIIQKDLVPLLVHEKDDLGVLDAAVRLLVNLTIPVECLLPMDVMARTDAGRHTIFELNSLLASAKEAFVEPLSTRSVLQLMHKLLQTQDKLTLEQCEGINNCLLLVRNVLHIPETKPAPGTPTPSTANATAPSSQCSKQNQILWNLFAQGVDKVLIHLMTCPQKGFWSITMVQLIALTYKDQHVGSLQKLLNLWFESSLSESSEDNESNTSPPEQNSGDSSAMLTSDPTSDSSDNSTGRKKAASDAKQHAARNQAEHAKSVAKQLEKYASSSRGKRRHAHPKTIAERKSQPQNNANGSRAKGTGGKNQQQPPQGKSKERQTQSNQQVNQNAPVEPEQGADKAEMASTSRVSPVPPVKSADSQTAASAAPPTSPAPSSSGVSASSGTTPPSTSGTKARAKTQSCSELSDCGYGTQVENQGSQSTSSNEDDVPQNGTNRSTKPVHQKPPHCSGKARPPHKPAMSLQETREWRRKKLVKRSHNNILNVKAVMHHASPTDEDISHLLKEFTVDFLLKGYGPLVEELHKQLMSDLGTPVDTSHFFWLVTYFLKFASQLDLELDCISPVLSYKVLSYLTFEGVNLCEQLQMAILQQESDLKPCLRRLHLVVTAIREFVQAVDTYRKSNHLSSEDREHLATLQCHMCRTRDLRNLFVLLLRHYNAGLQSRQYLQDLICTNHSLLIFLESCSTNDFDMTEHIKQFATAEIMQQYGRMLESFQDNGPFVNDCVFTMMHHTSGDLSLVSTLFQPGILKTFSLIWEQDFEVCDDWSDLIEYVIHKFVNTPRRGHPVLPLSEITKVKIPEIVADVAASVVSPEQSGCRWSKEECDTLYWYHIQCAQDADPVGKIHDLYIENGWPSKTRVGIIEQLYTQDIIPHSQYLELLKQETVGLQSSVSLTLPAANVDMESSSESSTPTVVAGPSSKMSPPDDISSLIALLLAENHSSQINWLQNFLLEACFVIIQSQHKTDVPHVTEAVPQHYIHMRQSIPLVPWNLEQAAVLSHPPFVLLLHKLGFHLPADVGKIFPRIPHFWTAEVLYATALKLGEVKTETLKFDLQLLQSKAPFDVPVEAMEASSKLDTEQTFTEISEGALLSPQSTIRFAPLTTGANNWMQLISKSKGQTDVAMSPSKELDSDMGKMSISEDDSSQNASAGEETTKPAD